MRGRTDHLLEVARLGGKLLLSYSVAAWLAYLGIGAVMASQLASGSVLPLVLGLVMALPAPLLLSRRSSRRSPALLAEASHQLASGDGAQLVDIHQRLQHQTGLSSEARGAWEDQLLEAWNNLSGPTDHQQALSLRDLLHARQPFARRELDLLRKLGPLGLPPLDLLLLWRRASDASLPLDHELLGDVLHRLPEGKPLRGLRKVRPLLFRLAREGHPAAAELLKGALSSHRLRLGQIPEDLRGRLGVLADAGARAASRVARGAGDASRSVARHGRGLRLNPRHLWLGAGAVFVALALVMVLNREKPAPPPTPPILPMDYAPPGNVQAGFTLQIMSSRDSTATAAFVAGLHADSIYAYTLPPRKNSTWYRVRLGWFAQREAADSVAALLKKDRVIDEWYVANFDLEGRLHETLSVPADTAQAGRDATP